MTKSFDHALLAARMLRPKRSDPWPFRRLVRGITDPALAWAAITPKLPPAAVSSSARAFLAPFVPAQAADAGAGRAPSPIPRTLPACLAVATDPEGLLAAEVHAQEVVKRLAPWGITPRPNILWSLVPEWPGAAQGGEPLLDAVYASLQRAAEPNTRPDFSMRAAFTDGAGHVQAELTHHTSSAAQLEACRAFLEACGHASQWSRACELELVMPRYEYAPGRYVATAGTPFAEIPSPFEPLLALMLLGYWLSGATDDALILVGTELISTR